MTAMVFHFAGESGRMLLLFLSSTIASRELCSAMAVCAGDRTSLKGIEA